jgi:DNA polymerase III subunit gamma/tau
MTYQVLARKWRPQMFETVVGQDAITRTLRNALASGRVAHAYLFAGPRGVGKTTTARLLARALLCRQPTGAEACGACDACVEAQAGTAVDLIEIDGASNRKIEDVRTLRESVKYAPARGRYKVYIIDEAHQLTAEAFNALLKTLEEPPPHVVFILATTDPREMPATILSRVQRFDFRPIPPATLAAALERILNNENVPFEPAALPIIVRGADGSLRDALSLLDTALAYGSGRLEAAAAAQLLGATAPVEVRAFASALIAHDTGAALEAVDRTAREGEDLEAFTRDVIELLRHVLVLKAAPTAKLVDVTSTEGNELRKLGEAVGVDELLYVLRAFLEADTLMRESPHPRLELEIAAVRVTRRPVPQAIEDLLRRVESAESRIRDASPAAPVQASLLGEPRPAPRVVPDLPRRAEPAPRPAPASVAPAPAAAVPAAGPARGARSAGGESAEPQGSDLATVWPRVVEEVMRKKPMLGAVIGQARPGPLERGELTIVLTGNHFQRELLNDPGHRELVLAAVRRHVAGAEGICVVEENNESGDARSHPAVRAVVAEFEGEVVAVRPRAPQGEGQ